MDLKTLQVAIREGKAAAALFVKTNPEDPANWFPCGFANLRYKCRKNAKEAKVLLAEGFRWDDYEKVYSHGAYDWTNTQSLNYKAAILEVMRDKMALAGVTTYVHQRWD